MVDLPGEWILCYKSDTAIGSLGMRSVGEFISSDKYSNSYYCIML